MVFRSFAPSLAALSSHPLSPPSLATLSRHPLSPTLSHLSLSASAPPLRQVKLTSVMDDLQKAVQQAALGSPTPGSAHGWTGGALSMAELAEIARGAHIEEELEREEMERRQQREAAEEEERQREMYEEEERHRQMYDEQLHAAAEAEAYAHAQRPPRRRRMRRSRRRRRRRWRPPRGGGSGGVGGAEAAEAAETREGWPAAEVGGGGAHGGAGPTGRVPARHPKEQ